MLPKKIVSVLIAGTVICILFVVFQPHSKKHNGELIGNSVNKTLWRLVEHVEKLENTIIQIHVNDSIIRDQKLNTHNVKSKSSKINTHITTDYVQVNQEIEYEFLVLVSSNLPHLDRRKTIRKMWGNKSMWLPSEKEWKVIFVTGNSKNGAVSKQVVREAKLYKDVIIEDVEEDFYSLSKKVMIGLQWAHTNFNYKFILKCDDDIFVQIDHLMLMLEMNKDEGYIGQPMKGQPVERSGRYALTKAEHPNDTFDPYCSGGAFILSFNAVNRIIPLFNWSKPLKIDDAYVGQLVHKAGIELHVEDGFYMWNRWCEYNKDLIISHPVKIKKCMDFQIAKSLNENGKFITNDILNKKDPYTDEERAKL